MTRSLQALPSHVFVVVVSASWLLAAGAHGADWPQYRCDAARSGYTSETLPAKLSLDWVRHARHAPRPAWQGRSFA